MCDAGWISVLDQPPPLDTPVVTKIDDEHGVRNELTLVMLNLNLWFCPDKRDYVEAPTHWRPL